MSDKIAFLSDIHANLPALRACLEAADLMGATRIVVCGDIVGDGPYPVETVELLRAHPQVVAIRGNVDRKILRLSRRKRRKLKSRLAEGRSRQRNRIWTALELGRSELEWLDSLPSGLSFMAGRFSALAVHGSPRADTDYIYPSLTAEGLKSKLAGVEERPGVLACGHSHIPFTASIEGTTVVNCGSVGRPADGDPRGTFAFVEIPGEADPIATIVRFSYPLAELEEAFSSRRVPGISMSEYQLGIKL